MNRKTRNIIFIVLTTIIVIYVVFAAVTGYPEMYKWMHTDLHHATMSDLLFLGVLVIFVNNVYRPSKD